MEEKQKVTDAEVVTKTDKPAASAAAETTAPAPEVSGTEPSNRKSIIAFIAGVVTALIIWQLYSVISSTNAGAYPNPVASVNGEAINQELFEQNLEQTVAGAELQGINVEEAGIKDELANQVLETLINTRLLVDAAEAAGYAPTEEEIADRIVQLETQFGGTDALDEELMRLGLDRDALTVDVTEQLSVDELLTNDVIPNAEAVTDEEIETVYNELVAAGQDMPELATVRDAIGAQLEQQKQQEAIEAFLEDLRANADIEIAI